MSESFAIEKADWGNCALWTELGIRCTGTIYCYFQMTTENRILCHPKMSESDRRENVVYIFFVHTCRRLRCKLSSARAGVSLIAPLLRWFSPFPFDTDSGRCRPESGPEQLKTSSTVSSSSMLSSSSMVSCSSMVSSSPQRCSGQAGSGDGPSGRRGPARLPFEASQFPLDTRYATNMT